MKRNFLMLLSVVVLLTLSLLCTEVGASGEVQCIFINGKILKPSTYIFQIQQEVYVPVRVVAYALGAKVYWEYNGRKVIINNKELNTTRIILGDTCYVPLQALAKALKAQVAYSTKDHSVAIWTKKPMELNYPLEKWLVGGPETKMREAAKKKSAYEEAEYQAGLKWLQEHGVTSTEGLSEQEIRNYGKSLLTIVPPEEKAASAPVVIGGKKEEAPAIVEGVVEKPKTLETIETYPPATGEVQQVLPAPEATPAPVKPFGW